MYKNKSQRVARFRVQSWMLWIIMLILITGLPGALLPGIAFEKLSWLTGYGKPPLVPLTIYLAGNAGFVFVALGILVWFISRDLKRYQPLVRVLAWIMILAFPAYISIDIQCGLPWWWILIDSVGCLLIGLTLLWATPKESFVINK